MENKKNYMERFFYRSSRACRIRYIDQFLNKKFFENKSVIKNLFSSKPKQIAQAAIQILLKVYGDLNSVNFLVISDMKLPIDIAQNFEKHWIEQISDSSRFTRKDI